MKVEIDIPQQLHDFLRALSIFADTDIKKHIEHIVVSNISSDFNRLAEPLIDQETIRAKYGVSHPCMLEGLSIICQHSLVLFGMLICIIARIVHERKD